MKYFPGLILFILIQCMIFPTYAASDKHIILKAKKGNIVLEGELLGYDASHYRIDSSLYGVMTVLIEKFACIGDACPGAEKQSGNSPNPEKENQFGITGSTLMGLRLTPSLLENFARDSGLSFRRIPGVNNQDFKIQLGNKDKKLTTSVIVRATGTSAAFSALVTGQAEIGMATRPAKKYERELATRTDQTNELKKHIVALDAIAIIVSPNNKINALSVEQIAKIFSGEIRDWAEVGGTAGKITIYSRNRISGIADSFRKLALLPYHRIISDKSRKFTSGSDLSEAVAADTRGIGYVGLAYAENAKTLSIKQECGLERAPTAFNIKTREYPYARELYFYTTNETKHPLAKKFVKYSLSDEAKKVIRSSGFIDQSIGYLSFSHIGDKLLSSFSTLQERNERLLLKSFVRTFQHSNRLSTTFRFEPNSVRLDRNSIEMVLKLGPLLLKARQAHKKIYLVGFSDSVGDFEQNRQIALLRARQVKNTLAGTFSGLIPKESLVPVSFGELLPVSCNNSTEGRVKNRRVEVWIPQ